MPSSLLPATTSAVSSAGLAVCCSKSSAASASDISSSPSEIQVLHGRLIAGALEQTIDVRKRAGGLIRTASGDNGAHAEPFDRLSERQRGSRDAQPETNITDHLSRE